MINRMNGNVAGIDRFCHSEMNEQNEDVMGSSGGPTAKLQRTHDRIRGSLMAGAAGDALGYTVEFMSRNSILARYGNQGVTEFELNAEGKALVSDDTQMTLFTACGMLMGVTRGYMRGIGGQPERYVDGAYLDWYYTQTGKKKQILTNDFHYTWLRDLPQLAHRRAPGNTCLSACESLLQGKEVHNNSKGCGGIMRVAPMALLMAGYWSRGESFYDVPYMDEAGGEVAAVTHKHPLAILPSAMLTHLIYRVIRMEEEEIKAGIADIALETIDALSNIYKGKYEEDKFFLARLTRLAVSLAANDKSDAENIRALGEGWVGEEAWAIALYCAVRHIDSIEDAIIAAVNHDGDSDSTGAICGNIMGAIYGYEAIKRKHLFCPQGKELEPTLELSDIILTLADDLFTSCIISEYSPIDTPEKCQWYDRYCEMKPVGLNKKLMYDRAHTPERISELKENEIFVFGSNLAGAHAGGAARVAHRYFGAEWGRGVGLTGRSYAIPTMQGGVSTIQPYVDQFIAFAREHSELTFLVTRIGCGIAGFHDSEIAPLFADAINVENVILPKEFVACLAENVPQTAIGGISWDSNAFLSKYNPLMQQVHEGAHIAYFKVKELRVEEYRNTIDIVNQGFYTTEKGQRVQFSSLKRMEHDTTFYSQSFRVDDIPTRSSATQVVVRNVDCLDEGVRLAHEGYNPAVLNMASRSNPGGGVLDGAGAQEETLFRRTNLFRSLYQYTDRFINQEWYAPHITLVSTGERYPMDRNFGGIYTPGALLFREDERHGYKLKDSPQSLSFISVAGINRPDLKDATHLADNMIEETKNKMRTILRIGLRHGHDSLVLGALGCGAFRNPPSHIARLFHEVFEEQEFKNKYRLISFAILDDHNAHRSHNPEGNYLPFEKEFSR
ncbi:MAG: TIGR02452 family protein [Sodaliphilus sp.]